MIKVTRTFGLAFQNTKENIPNYNYAISLGPSRFRTSPEKKDATETLADMKLEINHPTIYNYVEFSFSLPINDLFYEKWDANVLKPDGHEINGIADVLAVPINKPQVEKDYWNNTDNVEVYHSDNDREVFIMFDLIRDPYDQCNMIHLGVRCLRNNDEEIRDRLLHLYKKRNPRSNFQIDYFNQSIYRKIFGSDFYFYKLEENKNRRINHHNLL